MASKIIELDEKRLERISPTELSHHLMRLPAKKRLEVILSREDAEAVVAALPDQDFYLSLKEIGAEDALSLLSLANVSQLNYLFDLEWWQKDRVLPAKAVEWLDRLARAGEEQLLKWLYDADFELLLNLFKKWIRVETVVEDVDLTEVVDRLPRNTLDDQYFWETLYPQYEDFLKRLLSLIFETSYGFYKELMNHVMWAIDAETEEQAYRFHKGRLEDHAIPDFYDAISIYTPLEKTGIGCGKQTHLELDASSPPFFALAVVSEGDLLGQALRQLRDPAVLGSIQLELAAVANKVIVADQLCHDEPENLRLAVEKTAAYVNLGLQLLGGDALEQAQINLHEIYLEHLFRLAHSRVMTLKQRMQRLYEQGWLSRWPERLHCLDPAWMDAAEALMRRTPRIWRFADARTPPREDFFRTVADLQRAAHCLDVIESLGALLDLLAPETERFRWVLWQEGQVRDLADVTITNMVFTAAANFRLDGRWQMEPISLWRWHEAFAQLGPDQIEQSIRSWLAGALQDPTVVSRIETYLHPNFSAYRDEMASFSAAHPPKPALVRFFLFKA